MEAVHYCGEGARIRGKLVVAARHRECIAFSLVPAVSGCIGRSRNSKSPPYIQILVRDETGARLEWVERCCGWQMTGIVNDHIHTATKTYTTLYYRGKQVQLHPTSASRSLPHIQLVPHVHHTQPAYPLISAAVLSLKARLAFPELARWTKTMTQIIHPINRAKLATERPRMVKYQTAMGKGQRADEAMVPVLISSS